MRISETWRWRIGLGLLVLLVAWFVPSPEWPGKAAGQNVIPCSSVITISQTAGTQLVAGVTGQKVYVCSLIVQNGGTAQSVSLTEGTGTVCATGPAALIGSATVANGVSLAINSGFTISASAPLFVSKTAGDAVCLLQSGTTLVAGTMVYSQQ